MRRLFPLLLIIAAAAVVLVLLRRDDTPPAGADREEDAAASGGGSADGTGPTRARQPDDPVQPENLPAGTRAVPGKIADFRFTRLDDGRSIANEGYEAVKPLHQDDLPPEEDLERLEMVMNLYKWAYKVVPEGGDNYEIMAGLTGDNPHRIIFFPPDHPSLDPEGNLRDRWGHPYFFHKLTDQLVDIISSGPDGRMGTNDDLGLGHTREYEENISEES